MCRILFISQNNSNSPQDILLREEIIKNFSYLSEFGHVPKGHIGGHKDGYGFTILPNQKEPILFKSTKPILEDEEFSNFKNILNISENNNILFHIRAATCGEVDIKNSHPFFMKIYF